MVEESGCGELQQLVQEEECEEPLSRGGEATPPSTSPRSQHPSKNESHSSHVSQQVLWESNTQTSPIVSKGSSGQATSQGSMVSGRAINFSNHAANQSRLIYLNEKEKQRPNRPEPPRLNRQQKDMTPCKHHCFLSEVPDVRRMEQALLQLLEDFHSGNLRAFGKDCSMEQMTEIREQQERLARLHFELGQRQEVGSDQSGLRQSSANMRHLLHRLQQLSVCIEKLHSEIAKYQKRYISGIACFLTFARIITQQLLPKTFTMFIQMHYTFVNVKDGFPNSNPVLVEFTKAGLSDPVLIRLDVESKLPEELSLSFIISRPEEKLAVLLALLKNVVAKDSKNIIFVATMHHVEYLHQILDKAGISNTFIYSNLDPSARKINAAKFQMNKVNTLIVTDVAARGIDIPHLDNVINYNFPAKCKLFVHRVGRCARAGRTGTAYSIVTPDEYPYLLDLHLFLGRSLNIIPLYGLNNDKEYIIGKMPQAMVEEEIAEIINWHDSSTDLKSMRKVCDNAYERYIKSRPAASSESVKRVKELNINSAGIIPEYSNINSATMDILTKMKQYRPPGTIFEIDKKTCSIDYKVMKEKRAFHKENILNFHKKMETLETKKEEAAKDLSKKTILPESSENEINETFNKVILPKKRSIDDLYKSTKKKKRLVTKDEEFYIPYSAPDKHTEDGFAVNNFTSEAKKVQLDLTGDNEESLRLQTQLKKWDRKKKKMITVNKDPKAGKIRTESGAWIPATYKTNRYTQWKEKSKIDAMDDDDSDEEKPQLQKLQTNINTRWARHNQKIKEKVKARSELKRPEQILKARKLLERKKKRNGRKSRKGQKKGGKSR